MLPSTARQINQGNLALLNALLIASPDMIFCLDKDGTILDFHSASDIASSISIGKLMGTRLQNILPAEETNQIKSLITQTLQTGKLQICKTSIKIHHRIKHIEARYIPCSDSEVIVIVCDVTIRKQTEYALRESEARFKDAFDCAAIGRVMAVPQGRFIRINNSFCKMLGYTKNELLTKTWLDLAHPDDLKSILDYTQDLLSGKIPFFRFVHRLIHKSGKSIWVDLTVILLKNPAGVPLYFVCDIVDITERKISEQVLKYLATHDPLTGLPNRTLFSDRLHHALSLAGRSNTKIAVMFIDLDGFKSVNDAFGHEMGDQVLKRIAKRLNACVRKSDTLARFSGDEFTLIVENITNPDDAAVIAKKILKKLSIPLMEQGQQITITASIGISIYPNDGEDEKNLLKRADAAMYQVKNTSKNGFRFFS